jgi:hypothetical protein
MSLHEQSAGASSEWRTPPYVFTKLGCEFDLDVASPGAEHVPWIPANHHLTRNSLTLSWGDAFCWMNAPFGGRMGLVPWLMRVLHASRWRNRVGAGPNFVPVVSRIRAAL